jgi:hypothetical protein
MRLLTALTLRGAGHTSRPPMRCSELDRLEAAQAKPTPETPLCTVVRDRLP